MSGNGARGELRREFGLALSRSVMVDRYGKLVTGLGETLRLFFMLKRMRDSWHGNAKSLFLLHYGEGWQS